MSTSSPPPAPPFPSPAAHELDGRPIEPEPEQWREGKSGKQYISRGPRQGLIFRQGDETPEQARERDQAPERRPRKRAKLRKVPDPPREPDLKELEQTLTEALKQPGLLAAAFGDEWAAEHFVTMAPAVSRNLVVASKHNPWLKRKLEDAATGQDAAMAVLSLVPLGGAVIMYLIPPLIYWFDLPISEKGRKMLGDIPHRGGRPAPSAVGEPPPFVPPGMAGPPPAPAYAPPAESTNSAPPADSAAA